MRNIKSKPQLFRVLAAGLEQKDKQKKEAEKKKRAFLKDRQQEATKLKAEERLAKMAPTAIKRQLEEARMENRERVKECLIPGMRHHGMTYHQIAQKAQLDMFVQLNGVLAEMLETQQALENEDEDDDDEQSSPSSSVSGNEAD